jgi:hypothetical protein
MAPVAGSGQSVPADSSGDTDGAAETAGHADGALLLLERLKRELDPDGMFPDVTDLMPGEVRS